MTRRRAITARRTPCIHEMHESIRKIRLPHKGCRPTMRC
ncbi:hypothetical protein BURCENBC7_AP2767 [Burkholderia cenocepacia BC7]|nr:uncharacterized protein BCN122_II1504 [Burkholderia cenocepacia]EPZ89122.1 hypothetical protein BURCENK562V_C3532 [Burkholderia cenocepacia K56-2Valvano]ERI29809.1 hypothetical protein BURCENBC7_AP2767 [Burkholderia cenocepacia BC7]